MKGIGCQPSGQAAGIGSMIGHSMAKAPKTEHSELAGEFTQDDITVLVDIYREAGTNGDWILEVITPDEDVTSWEEPFATDREAFDEFLATVERDGIRSFFGEPDPEPMVH
jgi:hypothetical protein